MPHLPPDPLAGGIADYGARLRRGEVSAEAATADYLARIAALDPRLGAYQHVAAEAALASARAIDAALAAGFDLGPLMGVPVAVKDLFAVDGMPVTAGSRLEIADLVGPPGDFVGRLKRAGCVLLGKTKTVEFAFGGMGINEVLGTPWNPWDAEVHRVPGGSSSGSAVAMAAGLCGFAIGTDTGGSVRLPAGLCGIVGLKTTAGRWPLDGIFPLHPELDTIGLLTRSVADAALAYATLEGEAVTARPSPAGLRFGRPEAHFYENLSPTVAESMAEALARLEQAGVEVAPVEMPEAKERSTYFPVALASNLVAVLGRERYLAGRESMDPVVAARAARALDCGAIDLAAVEQRRRALTDLAARRMAGFDAWVTPTAPIEAPPVAEAADVETGVRLAMVVIQNTQPGNLFGQCGLTLPLVPAGGGLPVGLQLLCNAGHEAELLAMAAALEATLPRPATAPLEAFAVI